MVTVRLFGQIRKWRLLYAVWLASVLSTNLAIEARGTNFDVSADFYSKYIWRGQNLDDDPVFQTGLSAHHEGLTAAIWGNIELTNINGNSGDFSEVDYSLDYTGSVTAFEGLRYSVGLIYYDFPGTDAKDTTEIYLGLNLDLPVNSTVTLYHDVDEADGTYITVGIGRSIENVAEFGPDTPIGMEIGASVGWGSSSYNKYYWGTKQSKLNDLKLSVSFPIQIAGWAVAPSLNYVTLLSDDIRDTDAYGTDSDFFFAGIILSKRF